jgi:uncharacterized repeat protein (TIGR03803 family)
MTGIVSAQTHLWGITVKGGALDSGTIFTADVSGNNIHSVYSCHQFDGAGPVGGMVMAGNEKFYGNTEFGGCGDSCVCFCYNAHTGIFTNIHDYYCNSQYGDQANSAMMLASDGKLYGLCSGGGAHSEGVLYSVDPTTNSYTDVYDFIDSTGYFAAGAMIQLSNGKLYGTTQLGGTSNGGALFSFDPSNSTYTLLHSFQSATGRTPYYCQLLKATDGKLYGMTEYGGADSAGVIFSYDATTNVYTNMHDFDITHGGNPMGSLLQATNGLLYGMTYYGGANMDGTIFSFDISNSTYLDLFDFNATNGRFPTRSLFQASSGLLFGSTYEAGANGFGVFFSFNITTNIQTVLYNFDGGINGKNPDGDVVEVADNLTSGIKTITDNAGISVYPNPAKDQLTISNWQGANCKLSITDIMGKEVYNHAYSQLPVANCQLTIDLSQWSNGFYFYQLSNNKETYRGKFVKE